MSQSLEQIVATPTLREELIASIKSYPDSLKHYTKSLGPAGLVAVAGSTFGQWLAAETGHNTLAATTTAAYIFGYLPSYTTFFAMEYYGDREKYPKILGKEFGHFITTFLAADYVADLFVFTPAFLTGNFWLEHNTELSPPARNLIAWPAANISYIITMAGLHPVARRVSNGINNAIKSTYRTIRGKRNSPQSFLE